MEKIKKLKIEIIERDRDNTTTSFDLIVDGEKVLENTGLNNCCEEIFPAYTRRLKKLNKQSKMEKDK